ncbi:hypothetical protein Leryth_015690 [Lithospermum erythrorhizon]|nr:hypothetical protein Leryth_015690 [Lithospermum erythrorhizon]
MKALIDEACGTTALTAMFLGKRLMIANAGDSRAILCSRGGVFTQLTEDHRPDSNKEKGWKNLELVMVLWDVCQIKEAVNIVKGDEDACQDHHVPVEDAPAEKGLFLRGQGSSFPLCRGGK